MQMPSSWKGLILELGIVSHSVIIGLSLGVSQSTCTIRPLIAALSFHQFFEGFALGGCISQAQIKTLSATLMACFFAITTPLGIGVGTAISSFYNPYSTGALITEGILDSLSAGILVYMALVDLIAADFLTPKTQSSAPVPSPHTPPALIVFSLVSPLHRPRRNHLRHHRPPVAQRLIPIFRCGKSEDTFRAFYSLSTSRQLGDKNGWPLVDRPKLLGFVGIQTGFGSADRRAPLRSTWFPSDPDGLLRLEQATGLAFRFVIGRSKDAKKMAGVQKEIDKYRDFLIIDVNEEYLNLPWKTLAFFKAAFQLFEADYYVKADDDIYLRPGILLRMFSNEDVTIGSWMLAMNVNHEDNRALCDPRCTPTSIAVWDIPKCSGLCNPASRLKELHAMSMCSKSPTLRPGDR
ncbi:hypothetical protein GBA52_001642 [Prunus armeniaca]|nr:hypothetical protein GBA52_001642 [Prunus armeniaca]